MKKTKQSNHGGPREGAGRPGSFSEATTTLSIRVPESKKEFLKAMIQKQLKKWQN